MAKTRDERILELKAQRDRILAEAKAKIAAKEAEFNRRIKAAAKDSGSDRKHQAHIKIVGFGAIMKEARADESGKIAKLMYSIFTKLSGDLATSERRRKEYQELATLFEQK